MELNTIEKYGSIVRFRSAELRDEAVRLLGHTPDVEIPVSNYDYESWGYVAYKLAREDIERMKNPDDLGDFCK